MFGLCIALCVHQVFGVLHCFLDLLCSGCISMMSNDKLTGWLQNDVSTILVGIVVWESQQIWIEFLWGAWHTCVLYIYQLHLNARHTIIYFFQKKRELPFRKTKIINLSHRLPFLYTLYSLLHWSFTLYIALSFVNYGLCSCIYHALLSSVPRVAFIFFYL